MFGKIIIKYRKNIKNENHSSSRLFARFMLILISVIYNRYLKILDEHHMGKQFKKEKKEREEGSCTFWEINFFELKVLGNQLVKDETGDYGALEINKSLEKSSRNH